MDPLPDDGLKYATRPATAGDPRPGAIYRHYRGGLYVVVARSVMVDTLEPLVAYRNNRTGEVWTRPLASFTGRIEAPGLVTTRFCRVED